MSGSQPSLRTLLVRSGLTGMVSRIWTLGGWLLLTPWVLRDLGPEGFGVWSLLFLLTGYFAAGDLGLSSAMTRLVADGGARGERHGFQELFRCSLGVYPVMALAWLGVVLVFRDPWLEFLRVPAALLPESRRILLLSPLLLLGLGIQGLAGGLLSGLQRTDIVNRNQLLASIPGFGGVWLALSLHLGLMGLFWAALAGVAAGMLLNVAESARREPEIRWVPAWPGRIFLSGPGWFGARVQLITLAALFHVQVDKILLAHFRGLSTVSEYELGFRIASLVLSFPMLTLPAIMPAAARLSSGGRVDDVRRLYVDGSRILLLLALPLAGIGLVISPGMISGWLGAPHEAVVMAARWLLLAGSVNLLTGVGTSIARGTGAVNLELVYALVSQALHLALSLLLVNALGLQGVLYAQFLSVLLGTLLFLALFHRRAGASTPGFLREAVMPSALAGVVAGVVALGIMMAPLPGWPSAGRLGILARIAVSGLVGGAAALTVGRLAGWVRTDDLGLIRAALGRKPAGP